MDSGNWISVALVLLIVALYVYKYLTGVFSFWKVRQVPYIKPNIIFGNSANVVFRRIPMSVQQLFWYRDLEPHKYGGIFQMRTPILIIRDPELIKRVLIKDFNYFEDRAVILHEGVDPLCKQLFMMKGEEWKNLRFKMTSAFSSGKMKTMLPLMEECALQMLSILDEEINTGKQELEVKKLLARYGIDVIGSCAFGLQTETLKNPNSEFVQKSEQFFEFRIGTVIRSMWPTIPISLIKLFGLTFISQDLATFFTSTIKDTVDYRVKNGVIRNDFMDVLIKMKNDCDQHSEPNKSKHSDRNEDNKKTISPRTDMTIELMTAQCLLFLGAGFDTTATTASFFLFEISAHTEIQDKLRQEINDVLKRCDNQFTYDTLKQMKYLDMVLSETLRKYPPATFLFRECTANYKLEDSDLIIPKGMIITVPIIGLHYDEKYYPDPYRFNPENFSEEANLLRKPYTYMPFGEGPRMCIAERFAKMQVKTALVHLIKNYEFRWSPKMKEPFVFENSFCLTNMRGGTWLQCKRISNA